MTADRGASILGRLLNLAKRRGDDYNLLPGGRLRVRGQCHRLPQFLGEPWSRRPTSLFASPVNRERTGTTSTFAPQKGRVSEKSPFRKATARQTGRRISQAPL
jgi:hypothetical protein